jgi:hypothetical protein
MDTSVLWTVSSGPIGVHNTEVLLYLKKAVIEPSLIDLTRHLIDKSFLNCLHHMISDTDYYGSSLFHLATDMIISFIFQQPSQLSLIQENGLVDSLMKTLFEKDLLSERDVLALLPDICAALCLNTRGLENFLAHKPFDRLIRILSAPIYLAVRRQKCRIESILEMKSSLENVIDESKRDEVNVRKEAMKSIIILLAQLVRLINDCQERRLSTSETDTDEAPLATLFLMFNHSILNQNKQSIDLLFQLLSLISQHFPTYLHINKGLLSFSLAELPTQTTDPNRQLVLSDDKVVGDPQLDLIVKTLTSKLCSEDGLEFAIRFLLNVSNNHQIARGKILHALLSNICVLAKDLNEDIK